MIGNILGNVVGFLLMLGVPLAACIYYLWRRDGRIWMFFAGILSFTVSQLLIRIPLLQYAGKKWEWLMLLPYTSLVLYYGFLGLTAGLFEETGRWAAFGLMKRRRRALDWKDALALGLGHGGVEAVWVAVSGLLAGNLDFTAERGEFVAVMGRSGSGKSTFLKIAGTLEDADAGKVWIGEKEIQTLSRQERCEMRQGSIGFVFQKYQLLPEYTIWDNVCMPLYIAHQNPDRDYIQQILERAGLWERCMDYPEELSGGEQQRVAIARAMVAKPEIILADEPTGNLDSKTSMDVILLMQSISRQFHQTTIMITHNEEIAQMADRTIRIEDGKVVSGGVRYAR